MKIGLIIVRDKPTRRRSRKAAKRRKTDMEDIAL
jgi:hypothetical protein